MQVVEPLPSTLGYPYAMENSHSLRGKSMPDRAQALLLCVQRVQSIPISFVSSPLRIDAKKKSTKTSAHLFQKVLGAQAENLHIAVPVTHGKERRPHSVFRHFPHLQARDLHPPQLFRADFLEYRRGRGDSVCLRHRPIGTIYQYGAASHARYTTGPVR